MQFIGISRLFHGIAGSSKWRGVSQINSGDASVVVSATNIYSGYPIHVTKMSSGGNVYGLYVDSVVNGKSMAVACNTGTAGVPVKFGWMVMK